jgi:hypothetical protein
MMGEGGDIAPPIMHDQSNDPTAILLVKDLSVAVGRESGWYYIPSG